MYPIQLQYKFNQSPGPEMQISQRAFFETKANPTSKNKKKGGNFSPIPSLKNKRKEKVNHTKLELFCYVGE